MNSPVNSILFDSDLSDSINNNTTIRLEVFIIHEDYKEKPPIYFLTLRKNLKRLARGFVPDAFIKIEFGGKKEYITQKEFEKDATAQYINYKEFVGKVKELYSRHFGKNSSAYKEIEDKYYLDRSFDEDSYKHKRKQSRHGGVRISKATTKKTTRKIKHTTQKAHKKH